MDSTCRLEPLRKLPQGVWVDGLGPGEGHLPANRKKTPRLPLTVPQTAQTGSQGQGVIPLSQCIKSTQPSSCKSQIPAGRLIGLGWG